MAGGRASEHDLRAFNSESLCLEPGRTLGDLCAFQKPPVNGGKIKDNIKYTVEAPV
jgi:hypothetical protein